MIAKGSTSTEIMNHQNRGDKHNTQTERGKIKHMNKGGTKHTNRWKEQNVWTGGGANKTLEQNARTGWDVAWHDS